MCPKRPGFFNLKGHIMEIILKTKEEKEEFERKIFDLLMIADRQDQKIFIKELRDSAIISE